MMSNVKPYLFDECFDEEMITASKAEEMRQNAFNEGESSGIAKAREMNETHAIQLLPQIAIALQELGEVEREKLNKVSKLAAHMAAEIIGKIFPSLEKMGASAEVQNFITEQVIALKNKSEYVVTVNPILEEEVKKYLDRNVQATDINVQITTDPEMDLSDCRAEWEQGGVERITSMILEQIIEKLSAIAQENLSMKTEQISGSTQDATEKATVSANKITQVESQATNEGGEENE